MEQSYQKKSSHTIAGNQQSSVVSEYGLKMQHTEEEQMDSRSEENQGYGQYLSVRFYRQYFKVTQVEVLMRIRLSLRPFQSQFFQISRENPDLYGPFWILTTIVFLLCSTGNLARYFNNWEKEQFIFKLTLVRYAILFVYGLGIGFPLGLGMILRVFASRITPIQMICLYGYSLSAFILVLILCVIPSNVFHWLMMFYGILNSSAFLIMNLNEQIEAMNRQKVYLVYALIAACQITIFLVFKLLFFDIVYDS